MVRILEWLLAKLLLWNIAPDAKGRFVSVRVEDRNKIAEAVETVERAYYAMHKSVRPLMIVATGRYGQDTAYAGCKRGLPMTGVWQGWIFPATKKEKWETV